jgi:hypothetical protein
MSTNAGERPVGGRQLQSPARTADHLLRPDVLCRPDRRGDHVATYLAWAYVGLRVVHSFVQILSPKVALRFMMFALGSLTLFILAGKEVVRILTLA